MEVQRRALLIAFLGPGLQALGWTWLVLHMLLAHWSGSFTARHLLYEPGSLIAFAGFVLTLLCVPLALEVTRVSQVDLEIPVYEPSPAEPTRHRQHRAHPRTR